MFFYDLVDIESLRELLPPGRSQQAYEVRKRAFSILHNAVIAAIFERLPKEHHEEFARRFAANPEDPTILEFLRERTGLGMTEDIRREFQKVLEQLKPLLC